MSAIVYLYHSISIDLESSRSYNSITLQAYTNGRRLVLVTVVWFWRRLSGSSNGRLVQGRSSGSGSGDGRLVLVAVVWFWQRSFLTCPLTYLPAYLPGSVSDSIRERGRPDRR